MRGDSVSVSAVAYHHNGVADQAVKLRVDHREEQAPDRGGARLARGGSLLWFLARCYAVREQTTVPPYGLDVRCMVCD